MSRLKVRRIDFQFPDDIAWQWCPGNPYWGNCVNYASVIGPAFERYFIKAFKQAIPLLRDEALKQDAELFCHQEAQHSKQHLAHLAMLSRKYPWLEETRKEVLASYEALFAENDLKFHLAYAATIELMFGPLARFAVENRQALMGKSDARIASFFLWHLVEEFEHRNSAIDVYNALYGGYWYRLKCLPKVVKHIWQVYEITKESFAKIPEQDWDDVGPVDTSKVFSAIKKREIFRLVYELFCTLLPLHKPDNLEQPQWVSQWFLDEERGIDMVNYYP